MERLIEDGPGHEEACYQALLKLIHPSGLRCPRCGASQGWRVHRNHRAPVLDYLCTQCSCVFNAWTATPLQKTHLRPGRLWRLVSGVLQKQSLSSLARELGLSRCTVAVWCRRLRPMLRAGTLGEDPQPKKDIAATPNARAC
jgi:transposase-like protein